MKTNAHLFAVYFQSLSELPVKNGTLTASNKELAHRIFRVLRLTTDESVILFDRTQVMVIKLLATSKGDQLHATITEKIPLTPLIPAITVFLPLLKKEALEAALSHLTCVGVSHIQLYTSQKTHASHFNSTYYERLQRIIIAAAEQSKQFSMPEIKTPLSFEQLLKTSIAQPFFYADPEGTPSFNLLSQLHQKKHSSLSIMIGPEGDLTTAEKELLSSCAQFWRLTPTILKAEDALFLFTGMIRATL